MRWRFLVIFILVFSFSHKSAAQTAVPSEYKDVSSELEIPTEAELFKDDPDPVVMSAQIAVRLKKIQHSISLDYNEHVQKYISYNTNPKRQVLISKVLGRAKKFFPVFEPIFAQYGVPDEMKYLAVVESALNPFAVSPKGASGVWQFMYSTGLRYDLNISRKVDERRDPYKAFDAAARYLKEMYNLYGNWQLAIASYNCGAGNVNRAIKKAGGSTNFWDIRPYLPSETQAYVPTFIAMVYAMKYAKQYGISPNSFERETTQRVAVKEKITVNDLESLLGIPRQIIIDENPSLLTTLIPADFTLNLPASKVTAFTQFQDSLYAKAEDITTAQKLVVPKVVKPESSPKELSSAECNDPVASKEDFSTKPVVKEKNTAQKTETKNADEDISFLQKIKNKLKPKKQEETEPVAQKTNTGKKNNQSKKETPEPEKNSKKESKKSKEQKISAGKSNQKNPRDKKEEAVSKNAKGNTIVISENYKEDNDKYKIVAYTVKDGDNLGYISSWFHCKVKEIRRWNEINGNCIVVGDELLIYVHENDLKKFVRFNYLSNRVKDLLRGKIQTQEETDALLAKKEQKDTARLIDKINPVKIFSRNECFEMHTIRAGENLWTIAQKYDDVTVQDLMKWNGYKKTPVLHRHDEIKVRKIACK
ncbi:MAG: lytic transglycosylase [Bacteroidota bacterium]|nr:lytic transglycosylase [Bacteroidota bacterium]